MRGGLPIELPKLQAPQSQPVWIPSFESPADLETLEAVEAYDTGKKYTAIKTSC